MASIQWKNLKSELWNLKVLDGPGKLKGTIPMLTFENALTVNTTTKESETLLAVGTAYVQGEDVAARGRVLLFSVENVIEGSQLTVLQARLLIGRCKSDVAEKSTISLEQILL
ncbi:cleavage and polyadenylation specificity factor subunit 1 [Tanacetum coccineum]